MPMTRSGPAAVGLLVCLSCTGSNGSTSRMHVEVSVQADPGVPLRGVPIRVDGDEAGRTDSHGALRVELSSSARRELRIEPVCPDGYEQPSEPSVLRLRSYSPDEAHSSLELDLTCRPTQRRAAFVVRAIDAPGIAVRLDGEVIAHTNQDGVAHFSRLARPGTEYVLELDATQQSGLLPRSTAHKLELADADEIFLIEQKFEMPRVVRKSRPLRRRRIIRIE